MEDQKKQIEAAEKAVDQISTEAQNTIDSLKAKKTEIEDMKKAEDGMKDKKYDLAKSQDEELGKAMQKLEKLNKEIDELSKADKSPDKYDKKDEARANKLNGLIAQRSGLYSQLSQLVSSLSAAGDTTFKNSKNQSYTIKNLEKANNMLSSKPADPTPASIRVTTTNTPSSVSTGNEPSEITNLGTTHARLTEADLKGKSLDELVALMEKYDNSNDPSGAMRALITKAMDQE